MSFLTGWLYGGRQVDHYTQLIADVEELAVCPGTAVVNDVSEQ